MWCSCQRRGGVRRPSTQPVQKMFSFFSFYHFPFFHFSFCSFFSFFHFFCSFLCSFSFFLSPPLPKTSLFLTTIFFFKSRFWVREERKKKEERRKKEERADRNRSPSTIARTGTLVIRVRGNPSLRYLQAFVSLHQSPRL